MPGLELTWLGHAAFKFRTPGGKVLLIDPWLDNPKCPEHAKSLDRVDYILVTHGHFDHLGNTVDLARKHNAHVVGIFELYLYITSQGIENATGMNKGGTLELDGLRVTMVSADHSSGFQDGDRVVYCGDPVGYVVQLENGFKVYHAGDTNVFSDMQLIGRLYQPDLALLPIGGLYTMSPPEASEAIRLLGVKKVIPMHYGTFPVLTGTPDELKQRTADIAGLELHVLEPGQTVMF